MLQKLTNNLAAIKNTNMLFQAVKDNIKSSFEENILKLKYYKISRFFKKTFHCSIKNLKNSYIYIGLNHLEFSPFSGILINNTHRLLDTFPRILALDSDKDSLKDLNLALDASFCPLTTQSFDYTITNIPTEYLFDSISLPFVFDRMAKNPEELEKIILALKGILKPGAMMFGFTINSKENLSFNAKQYIKQQKWHSLSYSFKDIDFYLAKHFDQIGMTTIGDLTLFYASLKTELKNADHLRPTLANTKGKTIRIPTNYSPKRFIDFRKPDLF